MPNLNLYVPALIKLKDIDDLMLNAPNGNMIMPIMYQSAYNLFQIVSDQVYFTCMEKSNGHIHLLHINKLSKKYIVDTIGNDLECYNYDVLFTVAEDLVKNQKMSNSRGPIHVEYSNDDEAMEYLIQKYNEWDSCVDGSVSTLRHCLESMVDIAGESLIYPLIDKMSHKNLRLPDEIRTQIVSPLRTPTVVTLEW